MIDNLVSLNDYLKDFFGKNEILDFTEYKAKITPELYNYAEMVLKYLVKNGILSQINRKNDVFYKIEVKKTKLDNYLETLTEPSHKKTERIGDVIAYNVPITLSKEMEDLINKYPSLNIIRINLLLKELLQIAFDEVLLSVPFLELDGLSFLMEEIRNLGKNNVKLKIITRGLLHSESEYGYTKKVKGFKKIFDLYDSSSQNPNLIELKDYTVRINIPNQYSIHYEGIHQKMLIVDDKYAYIGSGEIRGGTFFDNGDVGYVFNGLKAKFWKDFFMLFWNSHDCKKVSRDFFKKVII